MPVSLFVSIPILPSLRAHLENTPPPPPLSPSLRSSQCPDENIVELARGTLIGIRELLPLPLPLLLNPKWVGGWWPLLRRWFLGIVVDRGP